MTKEETIDRLRKISEKTPIRTNGDDLVAITMAIQALSLEPFINKPCVSSGVCEYDKNKVLDKIRAEIEQSWDGYLLTDNQSFEGVPSICINHALDIIDKYRG